MMELNKSALVEALARHERVAFQFSGGKDSTALLLLLKPYWDLFTVYYCDTGDAHPETIALVEGFKAQLPHFEWVSGRSLEVRASLGIPADVVPWNASSAAYQLGMASTRPIIDRLTCCYHSMMQPLHERMVADKVTLILRGQKSVDQVKGPLQSGEIVDGFEFCYPIQHLSDEDCFQVMREHNVAIPSYYTSGLVKSGDCLTCTAWTDKENRGAYLRKHFPDLYDDYRANIIDIAVAVKESVDGLEAAFDEVTKE